MSVTNWIKSLLSHRGKALQQYRSGMAKAKKGDYAGAISDYTASLRATEIPPDVKAMALYNRALAHSAIGENGKAADDLAVVLGMPGLPDNIKIAAGQRRERIRRRSADADNVQESSQRARSARNGVSDKEKL